MQAATAVIDFSALAHNVSRIREVASDSRILAVLKANAYGHGLIEIAEKLDDVDAFGVARIEEALNLRKGGVVKPIVLLEGFFNADDIPVLVANNIQTIIHHEQQLTMLLAAQVEHPIHVWLKVDTGMHRLGIDPDMLPDYYERLSSSANVASPVKLMTHFGCADDVENPVTAKQIAAFSTLTANLAGEVSMANSAGIIAWPASHRDWVRPGLMMYGVTPMINQASDAIDLQPVMTLKSSLIAIRQVKRGDSVGYGAAWTASEDTSIGVVAIGYGDGYPRHAENGTPVLIGGKLFPLVGRVSMDMITVDLGTMPDAEVGDDVILWGKGLPVEVIAEHSSTIAWELLCNITRRVAFEYQDGR